MSAVPHYQITSCCPQATATGDFLIPGVPVFGGVYIYSGPSFQEPTTGMWFYAGYCYTVLPLGMGFGVYPTAFNEANITLTSSNDCDSIECSNCEAALPTAYQVFPCCDTSNITFLNIDPTACVIAGDIWIYNGPGFIASNGFTFLTGECYNVTEVVEGIYVNGPACTDFTTFAHNTCQEAQDASDCPACNPAIQYLSFTSCCDDTSVIYFKGLDANTYFGVKEYLGALVDGLVNVCYSIEIGNVGDPAVPDMAAYALLPDPPLYVEGVTFSSLSSVYTDCSIQLPDCPSCEVPCYILYSCGDENIAPINTNTDLSAYIGQYINIIIGETDYGCFYVYLSTAPTCADAIDVVVGDNPCDCECNCYKLSGQAKGVFYIDCDGDDHVINLYLQQDNYAEICSGIYPISLDPILIQFNGPCVDGDCPLECYELVDCDGILPNIYTYKPSLGAYAILGQIVVLQGYPDTCWIVNDLSDCACAVDVVVIQSYTDCQDCKGTPNYQLTNCDDSGTIIYTSTDLSAVVGQVIIMQDCEGCWYVEEIDVIPYDTPISASIAVYGDCEECAKTYWLLQDCSGLQADIITYSDLSAYDGLVIKLLYCPDTCWEVSSTLDSTNAGIVIFDEQFTDCPECLLTFPCVCTTVRNDDTVSHDYRYYDCDLAVQYFTLASGETSDKFCIRVWAINYPNTDYVEIFGNCTEITPDVWDCPPPVYPRRSVQPGYNTPACTPEKYEKISCKSAEGYYKQVLYLRYGITDCCPDDTNKWLIKKELIDMDAMRDPDYECAVDNPCCPSTPSCGSGPCNCTSLITTCNSQ